MYVYMNRGPTCSKYFNVLNLHHPPDKTRPTYTPIFMYITPNRQKLVYLPTLELRPLGIGLALNCLVSSSSSRLRCGLSTVITRVHQNMGVERTNGYGFEWLRWDEDDTCVTIFLNSHVCFRNSHADSLCSYISAVIAYRCCHTRLCSAPSGLEAKTFPKLHAHHKQEDKNNLHGD